MSMSLLLEGPFLQLVMESVHAMELQELRKY